MPELQPLLQKIESLNTRQKIQLGITAFFGTIILIGLIFFLQAFQKTKPLDLEKFKAIERQNREIELKIQELKSEVAMNRGKILERNLQEQRIAETIENIDEKLNKLTKDEKINRVYAWGNDSLQRYFSTVIEQSKPYLNSN